MLGERGRHCGWSGFSYFLRFFSGIKHSYIISLCDTVGLLEYCWESQCFTASYRTVMLTIENQNVTCLFCTIKSCPQQDIYSMDIKQNILLNMQQATADHRHLKGSSQFRNRDGHELHHDGSTIPALL